MGQQTQALTVKDARQMLVARQEEFAEALAGRIKPEVFIRVAHQALTKSPKLLECTPSTLLMALAECASLGLMPSGALGEAYIVPYRNKGQMEAQFMPGYRGLVTLCRRSGGVLNIQPHTIHEGDEYHIEYGSQPRLHHVPEMKDARRGDPVAYYAVATLPGGGSEFRVMTKKEVDRIRARSKSGDAGPWKTDYEAMAWKTVIRQLVKYLPMATEEIAKALEADNRDYDPSLAPDRRKVDSLNAVLSGETEEPIEDADFEEVDEAPAEDFDEMPDFLQ